MKTPMKLSEWSVVDEGKDESATRHKERRPTKVGGGEKNELSDGSRLLDLKGDKSLAWPPPGI